MEFDGDEYRRIVFLSYDRLLNRAISWKSRRGVEAMKRSASRIREKIAAVALRILLVLSLLFFLSFPGALPSVSAAEEMYQVSKVEIRGNFLFAEETLQKAIQEYLGPRKTVRDLESIQNAIFSSYKQAGYTLVSIVIAGRSVAGAADPLAGAQELQDAISQVWS